jgi:class 3 adenylate cyclase
MPIFHFFKRPRIAVQLLTWFLTISLLPLAIVTFIVYERSKHSLEHEVTQDLLSVAQRQPKQILSYIRERERNVTTLSRTPDIIRAMKQFDAAFKQGGLLSPRYVMADSDLRPFLSYYQESSGYDDLYLFSPDGYAIFSVTQGEDLGTNFSAGIYRHTGLAEAFDRANTMLETGISDFDYYPVTNEPAAFIAAPVLDEGQIIGVVALQMNNEAIVVISAIFVARSISNPIRRLTWGTKRVAEGDLSQKIEISTKNEIGDLAQSFNEMTEGLRERNFIKETFGKYLSEEIRDEVLSGRIPLDGEFKEVTVMFADLRGFTTMTEVNDPKMIVTVMNSYFEAMGEAIQAEGGLILQFLGDEIYAVFGAPVSRHDHPVRAFRAALEMSCRLRMLNTHLATQGKPTLQHGIGLHTGQVVAANIGSPDRLSYLLVGDTVNLASRLQGLTKEHGVEIILSQETLSYLPETELARVELSDLGPTQVKGKSLAVKIFAVKSIAKTVLPA